MKLLLLHFFPQKLSVLDFNAQHIFGIACQNKCITDVVSDVLS